MKYLITSLIAIGLIVFWAWFFDATELLAGVMVGSLYTAFLMWLFDKMEMFE